MLYIYIYIYIRLFPILLPPPPELASCLLHTVLSQSKPKKLPKIKKKLKPFSTAVTVNNRTLISLIVSLCVRQAGQKNPEVALFVINVNGSTHATQLLHPDRLQRRYHTLGLVLWGMLSTITPSVKALIMAFHCRFGKLSSAFAL